MSDLFFRHVDPEQFKSGIVAAVVDALRPVLMESAEPRLVDRLRMAELLSVSVAKLDLMTSARTVPSVLVGKRRLYRPAAVIDALANAPESKAGVSHE